MMKAVIPILAPSLAIIACDQGGMAVRSGGPDPRDDTPDYLVDIAAVLGPEWTTAIIRSDKNGDRMYSDGYFDPLKHTIGRAEYYTRHEDKDTSQAFFKMSIALFETESEADNYFDSERRRIFSRRPNSQYHFDNIELPINLVFRADKFRPACIRTPTSYHCYALFRYDSYYISTDAFLVRDSVQYLTEDEFVAVLVLIDESFTSEQDSYIPQ